MSDNKWDVLDAPPPPMFVGQKEINLVKQLNDEILEKIVGNQIVYYPISMEHTQFHPLYQEAINKTFLKPIHVYVMVDWEDKPSTTTSHGVDHIPEITVHFHKRRLVEDQDLYVREGDFISYGKDYYEILSLEEPREIFGQVDHKMEISAKCIKARRSQFDAG